MAVVFISPKERQKMFFMGITGAFLIFMALFASAVFFVAPKDVEPQLVFNKPKVNINMSVFDSEQFKNLKPFTEMEFQFSYKGISKDKKAVQGFVSATSKDLALKILQNMDYTVSEIKEVQVGRDNPFIPYYQTVQNTKLK